MNSYRFRWIATAVALLLALTGVSTFAQDVPTPTFTDPTNITHLYCPRARIAHLIALGEEGGAPLRVEEMLLPTTRMLEWGGGMIEAVVSYYIAYGDGQLLETAFDFYAQDDAGNLYYLGEDVTNYEDGRVRDHEGTWLVGRDGSPPALFLPATPTIGMMWNPENRPGLVLETDEVLSLTETVMTPRGIITDGMRIQETLMDGAVEYKTWAVGYCDVVVDAPDEQAQTVWVNYTTDDHRTVPANLTAIEEGAEAVFDKASAADLSAAGESAAAIGASWEAYLAQDVEELLPPAFQQAMADAVSALESAVAGTDSGAILQAANDVSLAAVDLYTYYNPSAPTDLARMDALERQVLIDLQAEDLASATETLTQAATIWVRLRPLVLAQGGTEATLAFELSLNAQIAAVANAAVDGVDAEVQRGLEWVDVMERVF